MKLNSLTQKSSPQILRTLTGNNLISLIASMNSLNSDYNALILEWNNKLLPALNSLVKGSDDEITGFSYNYIEDGINGNTVLVNREADSDSEEWEFSPTLNRQLTIRESLAAIYNSLSNKVDSIDLNVSAFTDFTKEYIGEAAFTEGAVSNSTSMDARLEALESATFPSFTDTYLLFGDGSSTPATDSNLVWQATTARLILTGQLRVSNSIISTGGNERGIGAADLQYSRSSASQVASGDAAFVAGTNNTASAAQSAALNSGNTASSKNSLAIGQSTRAAGSAAFSHGVESSTTYPSSRAYSSGKLVSPGDSQAIELHMRVSTSNATPTSLYIESTGTKITTENNTSYGVIANIVGRNATTGASCFYVIRCLATRQASAATLNLSSLDKTVVAEDDPAFDATIVPDSSTGTIDVKVTGLAGITVRWSADIKLVMVK